MGPPKCWARAIARFAPPLSRPCLLIMSMNYSHAGHMSSAFDTIDQHIILSRLHLLGFRDLALLMVNFIYTCP